MRTFWSDSSRNCQSVRCPSETEQTLSVLLSAAMVVDCSQPARDLFQGSPLLLCRGGDQSEKTRSLSGKSGLGDKAKPPCADEEWGAMRRPGAVHGGARVQ